MKFFNLKAVAFQLFAILLLSGCGEDLPSSCADGCVDICASAPSGDKNQCVSDYLQGYSMGYEDGIRNRLTDGFNTDAFVAGYWDGLADGKESR